MWHVLSRQWAAVIIMIMIITTIITYMASDHAVEDRGTGLGLQGGSVVLHVNIARGA